MYDGNPGATESPATGNLRDFLGWVAARRRTYAEAMDAWRTSCPRLSAWEDATSDDLVRVEHGDAATQGEAIVCLTERGAAFLGHTRPTPNASYPSPVDSAQ